MPLASALGRAPSSAAVTKGREVGLAELETQLAGDDARDVEQIVDQPILRLHAARDHLEAAVDRRSVRLHADELGPPGDRVERGAQLVRHRGEEFILGAVRRLGRGAGFQRFGEEALARGFSGDHPLMRAVLTLEEGADHQPEADREQELHQLDAGDPGPQAVARVVGGAEPAGERGREERRSQAAETRDDRDRDQVDGEEADRAEEGVHRPTQQRGGEDGGESQTVALPRGAARRDGRAAQRIGRHGRVGSTQVATCVPGETEGDGGRQRARLCRTARRGRFCRNRPRPRPMPRCTPAGGCTGS
jgi:hypothetical protein